MASRIFHAQFILIGLKFLNFRISKAGFGLIRLNFERMAVGLVAAVSGEGGVAPAGAGLPPQSKEVSGLAGCVGVSECA